MVLLAKGHKGQKARSGGKMRAFEGGQMPLYVVYLNVVLLMHVLKPVILLT